MKNFTRNNSRYIVLTLSLVIAVLAFAKGAKADTVYYTITNYKTQTPTVTANTAASSVCTTGCGERRFYYTIGIQGAQSTFKTSDTVYVNQEMSDTACANIGTMWSEVSVDNGTAQKTDEHSNALATKVVTLTQLAFSNISAGPHQIVDKDILYGNGVHGLDITWILGTRRINFYVYGPVTIDSFTINPNPVTSGGTVALSWASTNADKCWFIPSTSNTGVSGAWTSGEVDVATSGSQSTWPLTSNALIYLYCSHPLYAPAGTSTTISVTAPAVTPTTLSVSTSPSNAGTITSSDSKISCGSTCSTSYSPPPSPLSAPITISQTPASGYTFSGWSGSCTGSASCSVNMSSSQTVVAHYISPQTSSVTLIATRPEVSQGGVEYLYWTSSNVSSCTAGSSDHTWIGSVATSNPMGVFWSQPTTLYNVNPPVTYTITCVGLNGDVSSSQYVSLYVYTPSTTVDPTPSLDLSASVSPIDNGASSVISWTGSNVSSCTPTGGSSGWTSVTGLSGTWNTGALTSSKTYHMSCTGAYGSTGDQQVTVTVNPVAPVAPIVSFIATTTDPSLAAAVFLAQIQPWYLKWSVSGATGCQESNDQGFTDWNSVLQLISGSSVSSQQVNPTATVVYTLDCWNDAGHTIKTAPVTVVSPLPNVKFVAEPSSIQYGDISTLTMTTENVFPASTTACMASGSNPPDKNWDGAPLGDYYVWDTTQLPLHPQNTIQSYSVTCYGPGGSTLATVNISIAPQQAQNTPSVTLFANPINVITPVGVPIGTTSLTWSTSYVDTNSCVASSDPIIPEWNGSVPSYRNVTWMTSVTTDNSTYTLTCIGTDGLPYSDTKVVTLTSSGNNINAPSDHVSLYIGTTQTSKKTFQQIPQGNSFMLNWNIPSGFDSSACTVASSPSVPAWLSIWNNFIGSTNATQNISTIGNGVGVYTLSMTCSTPAHDATSTASATLRLTQTSNSEI